MTDNENWAAHLRRVGSGVVPPSPADPHAMAATAVRRTRVRRAVVAGGSVTGIVAVVAGTAFALGGHGPAPEALPGTATVSTTEAVSADPAGGVPAGWHSERLGRLSYALPPELETGGPNPDEPGSESLTWHDRRDPDAPPFIHVQAVTPEYEFYDTDATGLRSTPGADAEAFDVAGAGVATIEDATDDLTDAVFGGGSPGGSGADGSGDSRTLRPVRFIVHPEGSEERYVISLNLPAEGSDALVDGLRASLRVD